MSEMVYRLPYGKVFHREADFPQVGLRGIACASSRTITSVWISGTRKNVPNDLLCGRCFPKSSPRLMTKRIRKIAIIALDKWLEYRNLVNWDRGIDEDGTEARQIIEFQKELGVYSL